MTRDEALRLLGLTAGSDAAAIRAAYQRQGRVLAKRRAAAGTPAAAAACEAGLAALHEAGRALLGGGPGRPVPSPLSPTQQHDLPLRAPRNTATTAGRPAAPPQPALAHSTPSLTSSHRDTPSPPPAAELAPGTVLAERFEVRRRLGSGGMGVVYAAFDRARGEEVAVKLLLPHLLGDAAARQRFGAEAKIASSLAHPHIVRVYDLHQEGKHTFLTMELLQGRSLRDEIHQRAQTSQRFTVEEVRRIGDQLCAALQEAHQQTVHRDVKPENIWLGADGTAKLMDFGIARLLRPSQFTSTGLALGTAYYMAPEQLKGSKEVDHRADQYALGVVLYELLTGEVPVGAIRPPHELRKSIPVGLSQAVMRALEGRPQDRHADMAALAKALKSRGRAGFLPRWAIAAAVVTLALGAAATWPLWRDALSSAPGTPKAKKNSSPEEQAAKVEYGRKLGILEDLKRRAQQVEAEITREEKSGPVEVEKWERELGSAAESNKEKTVQWAQQHLEKAKAAQALAAEIAQLWRQHPRREDWLIKADGHLGAAQALYKEGSYRQAVAELDQAEPPLRFPVQWYDHAREALALRQQGRAAIRDRLAHLSASPQTLFAWPEKLFGEVPNRLFAGDGAEGLAFARRAADWLAQTEDLTGLRHSVEEAASKAKPAARIAGLREKHAASVAALAQADEELKAGRADQSRSGYKTVGRQLGELATKANRYIDDLVTESEKHLAAGRFDMAIRGLREALASRPQDTKATTLLRQADEDTSSLRDRAEEAAKKASAARRIDGLRGEYAVLSAELAKATEARSKGRVDEARSGYKTAARRYVDLSARVDRHVEELVAEGEKALDAGRFDASVHDLTEALSLRPGHAKATELLSWAKAGNFRVFPGWLGDMAFSPDGTTLASLDRGSIKLWDVATGKSTKTLPGPTNTIAHVAFSPDGKTLASGSWESVVGSTKPYVYYTYGGVQLWDLTTSKSTEVLKGGGNIGFLTFSPDGKTLAWSECFANNPRNLLWDEATNIIKLWDVATNTKTAILHDRSSYFECAAFSPDSKTLATIDRTGTIKLWGVASGNEIAVMKGSTGAMFTSATIRVAFPGPEAARKRHTGAGLTLAFSPDGKTLASGSYDTTIKLWDVASGKNIATLTGHSDWVCSVAFSPDGKTLASGSDDKTGKLWNLASGKSVITRTVRSDRGEVYVKFSPSGKLFASDGIRLWRLPQH
jgi:WD40 repeat protein